MANPVPSGALVVFVAITLFWTPVVGAKANEVKGAVKSRPTGGPGATSTYQRLAQAAAAGDPSAQYAFGYLNESVDAGIFDYRSAIFWYRKAGLQGNVKAQHRLGYMYRRRVGVDTDYHEAIKWYRMAARQGHTGSMNSLGVMYDHGEDFGEAQNYVEAYKWFTLAAVHGNVTAKNNRDRIAKWMTPAQIDQARARADAWIRKFSPLKDTPVK